MRRTNREHAAKRRVRTYRKVAQVNARATGVRSRLGLGRKKSRRATADPLGIFALNEVNKQGRSRKNGGIFRRLGR